MRSYTVSEQILGGVIELFVSVSTRQKLCQLKLLKTSCCVCFQRGSSPKLLFNVSLPLLNNENLQWSREWKIRPQQTVWVTRFQLHTYYLLHRLFCIKLNLSLTLVHMNNTFFLLYPFASYIFLFHSLPSRVCLCLCVCVHVCICQSAKTPWGNWAFATPPYHKCEGIVNISAADGADAPSLPPFHTQRRQSKWIAINSSRSRLRPRLEQGAQGLGCCSGKQFYRQILSDYQQGSRTTLEMSTYKVILPRFHGRQEFQK